MRACAIVAIAVLSFSPGLLWAGQRDIAIVNSGDESYYQDAARGIRDTFSGQTAYSLHEFSLSDLDAIACVRTLRPGLIMTIGEKATDLTARQLPAVPTVFTLVFEQTTDRRRMTGVSLDVDPQAQFDLLLSLCPHTRKIGVIYSRASSRKIIARGKAYARTVNAEIIPVKVETTSDVYGAIRYLCSNADAVWMIPDTIVYTPQSTQDIMLHCLREKIPVIGLSPAYVDAGALFALSYDSEEAGRQAGHVALRVLDGTPPAHIPVQQPVRLDLSVNTVTAQRLGVTIPEKLLNEARHVYR